MAGRAQHHDRRPGQLGPRGDLLGHLEAIQVRHVGVEQHEHERPAGLRGGRQGVERLATAVDGRRPHVPARQLRHAGCAG